MPAFLCLVQNSPFLLPPPAERGALRTTLSGARLDIPVHHTRFFVLAADLRRLAVLLAEGCLAEISWKATRIEMEGHHTCLLVLAAEFPLLAALVPEHRVLDAALAGALLAIVVVYHSVFFMAGAEFSLFAALPAEGGLRGTTRAATVAATHAYHTRTFVLAAEFWFLAHFAEGRFSGTSLEYTQLSVMLDIFHPTFPQITGAELHSRSTLKPEPGLG